MKKVIYECKSTRVPVELIEEVQEKYKRLKKDNPKIRVIDVWIGLIGKA